MADHGSRKPLNWNTPGIKLREEQRSPEWSPNRIEKGMPLTRSGAAHGLKPLEKPFKKAGYEDPIDKAVLRPMKYGPSGAQFDRKRDEGGQFTSASEATGEESTAEDDRAQQERSAKTRVEDVKEKMGIQKASLPGQSTIEMGPSNDYASQQIGITTMGNPIFDDPFHSSHMNFTEQEHEEAAQVHEQSAQQAQSTGNASMSAQHMMQAAAHREQSVSNVPPTQRFMDNLLNPQSPIGEMPADGGDPAMLGLDGMQGDVPLELNDPGMDMSAMGVEQDPMAAAPPPMNGGAGAPPMGAPMENQESPDLYVNDMGMQDQGMDPMAMQDPGMDPMAMQDPGVDPMGMQDPGMDPMATSSQDPMGMDNLPMDMSQENMGQQYADASGPAPGMVHTSTGDELGQQTTGMEAFLGGGGAGEEMTSTVDQMAEEEAMSAPPGSEASAQGTDDVIPPDESMEVPESNAGFPANVGEDERQRNLKDEAVKAIMFYINDY